MSQPRDTIAILEREFDESVVKQKGKFDYVSHGLITERLSEADPRWTSRIDEVFTYTDPKGVLHCAGVTMTVCIHLDGEGSTLGEVICRSEGGGPQQMQSFALELKNSTSDCLKRAAMRFGIALRMWERLIDSQDDEDYQQEQGARPRDVVNGQPMGDRRVTGANPPLPATKADRDAIRSLAAKLGVRFVEAVPLTHDEAVKQIREMSAQVVAQEKEKAATTAAS